MLQGRYLFECRNCNYKSTFKRLELIRSPVDPAEKYPLCQTCKYKLYNVFHSSKTKEQIEAYEHRGNQKIL